MNCDNCGKPLSKEQIRLSKHRKDQDTFFCGRKCSAEYRFKKNYNSEGQKECNTCHEYKDLDEYYKDSAARDGHNNRCKSCDIKRSKKYYKENKEKVLKKYKETYTPKPLKEKTCTICDKEFKGRKNKKYCGPKCRDKSKKPTTHNIVCEGCGLEKEVTNKDATYCSHDCYHEHGDHSMKGQNLMVTKTCETCGESFESIARARYCKDSCNPSNWPKTNIEVKRCDFCTEYFTSTNGALYCKDKCKYQAPESRRVLEKYLDGFYDRTCNWCECKYNMLASKEASKSYCSNDCRNSAGKQARYRSYSGKDYKRKADKYDVYYEVIHKEEIFDRDGWCCQSCGIETPKDLFKQNTNNDDEPTLDHIIPISHGGPHSVSNVQLLCRKCNVEKSNSYEGQLAII